VVKFILLAVVLLSSCTKNVPVRDSKVGTIPEIVSKPDFIKKSDGSFEFPTLYWATPGGIAEKNWQAVFGGTVIEVENVQEKKSDGFPFPRKYVKGAVKVEKIFRNLPDSSEIAVGSVIRSEDFDGLKKGDKVVLFIEEIYEGGFVRIETDGTNSKLGFKVKDWNEPIIAALEKLTPCDKTEVVWVEGHPEDFKVKLYNCDEKSRILDDPQIAEIWKRYDPLGFQSLVEMRKLRGNG
jgi:hypothetical protein